MSRMNATWPYMLPHTCTHTQLHEVVFPSPRPSPSPCDSSRMPPDSAAMPGAPGHSRPFSFTSARLRLTLRHSLGMAASTQSTYTVVTPTTKPLLTAVPQRPVHYLSLNVLKLCIIELANKSSLIYGFLCWRAYSLKIHNPSVCLYNPLVFTYLPT